MTAAIWAAIAASFSALSSLLTMLIQRRNLLESARPELVLYKWTRTKVGSGDAAHEVVEFAKIKNVGRGPAFHININVSEERDGKPTAMGETVRLPILAPNQEEDIPGRVILWWKNVAKADGERLIHFRVVILCWDRASMRHETRYQLLASEHGLMGTPASDTLAPGLMLGTRSVHSVPVRSLKAKRWLDQVRPKTLRQRLRILLKRGANVRTDTQAPDLREV